MLVVIIDMQKKILIINNKNIETQSITHNFGLQNIANPKKISLFIEK